MPKKWLRFQDLKTRGLVNSWPALTNKIRTQDFPPGRMLGPNTRAWSVEEIEAFEESRPSAGPPPRGAAKAAKGRPPKDRQREAANEAAAVT
jgi:predicted DNA-binding transcriptional regulator AlpA